MSDDAARREQLDKLGIAFELERTSPADPARRERLDAVKRWYAQHWLTIDPKLRSSIIEGLSVFLSVFDLPDVAATFCPPKPALETAAMPAAPAADSAAVAARPPSSHARLAHEDPARVRRAAQRARSGDILNEVERRGDRSTPASTDLVFPSPRATVPSELVLVGSALVSGERQVPLSSSD